MNANSLKSSKERVSCFSATFHSVANHFQQTSPTSEAVASAMKYCTAPGVAWPSALSAGGRTAKVLCVWGALLLLLPSVAPAPLQW